MNNNLKKIPILSFQPFGIYTPARVTSKDSSNNLPEGGMGGTSGDIVDTTQYQKLSLSERLILAIPLGPGSPLL